MKSFQDIVILCLSTLLFENIVFSQGLGTSTMMSIIKSRKYNLSFGICVTYFSTLTSVIIFFVNRRFFIDESNDIYKPVIYILILGIIYIITLVVIFKFFNKVFDNIKKIIHISAFNSAVFGTIFLNSISNDTFIEYLLFGIFSGIGFFLALFMISAVYDKLISEKVPISFRGYPLILIYIGIISMAVYGTTIHI